MSLELTIMVVVLIVATVMGFPIGLALLGSATVYLLAAGQDPSLAAEIVLHGIFGNFVLLAVPLFIFAANVMNEGSISDRLLDFALALGGRFRGGLAHVNVLTSLFFAGMSGAATADVAGVGNILIQMMRDKDRYPAGFAAAITAASATIGPVFPPSIMMIFYALVSSTSIGQLFLGGMIPGVFMAVALMAAVSWIARRRNFPVEPAISLATYPLIFGRALFPLMMPIIMLGGIYSGAFTPTEAAAIAGLYALALSIFAYRVMGPQKLYHVFLETAKTTAIVATLIFGAFVFSYVLAAEQVPNRLAGLFDGLELTQLQFLLLVNAMLLLLGCFLASATIILVIVPILMPTVLSLGIDPVHFGVIVTLNVTIGLVTPPYGVVLFVISGLTRIPIGEIVRESWLLIGVLIVALSVLIVFPPLTLFLPSLIKF